MKVALITDTHAGVRSDSSLWYYWQELFYTNVFFPTLQERGIDRIVHGGDYFDRRKFVNFKTLDANYEHFLKPLINGGYRMDLLVGNHDVAYKTTNKLNSPELLIDNLSDQIHVYTEPTELPELDMLLVPWINNENYDEIVRVAQQSNMRTCYGHFEFSGFEMHKGQVIYQGQSTEPFAHFDIVLSGHYHTRSKRGNVIYLGAPFEYTWSDFNDPKGFHIFDTETLELEFIPNPYPIFAQLYYNDGVEQVIGAQGIPDLKDRMVKVIVYSKDDLYTFDMTMNQIYEAGPASVQIVEMFDRASSTMTDEQIADRAKDTPQLIDDFIDSMENVGENVQEQLKRKLQELYHAAEHDE